MTEPVKLGWMQRQSEVFKRWKRQYCVLYMDGGFSYFPDENRRSAEGSLHLPTNLNFIKVGVEVLNTNAPTDRTMGCLLEFQTSSGNLFFCADSPDDAAAWKTAMVEVKNMNVSIESSKIPLKCIEDSPQTVCDHMKKSEEDPTLPVNPCHSNPQFIQQLVHPHRDLLLLHRIPTPSLSSCQPTILPPAISTDIPSACTPAAAPPPCYTPTQQVVHTTVYRNGRRGYPRQTAVYSYPGQTYYGVGGNTTVYTTNGQTTTYPANPNQQGQTTVVVQENRNYRNDGFVAGAVVGSMMMAPLLFW
ncbi:putative pleckstrin-likey domain-containing family B member 1 isoform X2 [Apostichopus japonicus]|uniref:Putative pleckstrin-likey domain-containing family B member 1 isoform X2 n=1 Tax=Stichopus japonicus TaxID=307972 RepID=A0A2G8KW18_STIJA|nr:putative pleckstrin-likey domain-containing family B member 1 isoform X2 [Apostichopus japonicus]